MSTPSSASFNTKQEGALSPATSKKIGEDTAAVALMFPPLGSSDPTSTLHVFKDEHSNYISVAKACLQLTQFAGCNSSAVVQDSASVASSFLFHEATYVENALMLCSQQHKDRRCRILACKTLAILARSAYAKIRPSPLLFSSRDTRLGELEDEIGAEVPSCLVAAVLDDSDDGVSASAMEAIGIMVLSNAATAGSLVDDELQREVLSIGFCKPSPYAPSLRNIVDEDPAIPQMELSTRILDNIMAPRLIQSVERISMYKSTQLTSAALPTLTACLVHHVKTTPSLLSTMDRTAFAKRWTEVDAIGLVDVVVRSMLLPAMQATSLHGLLAACQAALRLAHVCPNQLWVQDVCQTAVQVLRQELAVPLCTEQTIGLLALLIVAARGIPLMERTKHLIFVTNLVAMLPSTTQAPFGVCSPGVLTELQGYKSYRRPAKTGLLAEIALSFFMDGPIETNMERHIALEIFFSTSSFTAIINERKQSTVISLFDELLLVFSSVAVETGRRFQFNFDNSPIIFDAESAIVTNWLRLARTVLLTFRSCVILGNNALYLEENLSLLTAGGAAYARLVQLYLHTAGLINVDASVAVKLASNACLPHLLWDPLLESAAFHSRFGAVDVDEADSALTIMDEFAAYETKQGLASHHLRMYLLTLAADAWVESRMMSIRQHLDRGSPLSLRVNTARAIAVAIGPKRLLSKILEGHNPPVIDSEGKKRRDPVKTLAKEALRASVAVIENIALVACSWRRRFGSSQETKVLVTFAVALLQGKVDETPVDDSIISIVGPVCDAAVARIHSEYQNEGRVDLTVPFPSSELIKLPVKPKIKPLVSNAKAVAIDGEKIVSGHLTQLIRQTIAVRTQQCILASSSSVDSGLTPSRPSPWLRLNIPTQFSSKDGRMQGVLGAPLASWESSVAQCSAASDAVALIAAYTSRRYLRCDGEEEFRVTVLMKAFNTVPAELSEGMKLELGVLRHDGGLTISSTCVDDADALLGGCPDKTFEAIPLVSCSAVYKQEIRSGEQLLYEVSISPTLSIIAGVLVPSVVYRNVPAERDDIGAKWSGEGLAAHGDASTATGGESKSGEDDFQIKAKIDDSAEGSESENAVLQGDSLALSPFTGMQPCPLVFFTNFWGDVSTFRFFWFSMPFRVAELKVAPSDNQVTPCSTTDKKLASISALKWDGEAVPGGFATALWAFMTLQGNRVFACLIENESGKNTPSMSIHFRGDDQQVLGALFASLLAKKTIIAALCPGVTLIE
ncbi:hypothetical protein MPSEU_000083600 [Mayamaea pseudoterrestris]|nr:hypothetical protein MPSEU_000083600 [Mayamaea pseudoterrestris]